MDRNEEEGEDEDECDGDLVNHDNNNNNNIIITDQEDQEEDDDILIENELPNDSIRFNVNCLQECRTKKILKK